MGSYQSYTNMLTLQNVILVSLAPALLALPFPDSPGGHGGPLPIPRPGADGSYGGDQFFQYINVPANKVFEWGYRRGSASHNREEYLSQKDHTFKAKVKWEDTYGGHGEHYYDINHGMLAMQPLLLTVLLPQHMLLLHMYSPPFAINDRN